MSRGTVSLAAALLCSAVITVAGQAPQGQPPSPPPGSPQSGPPGGGARFTPPTPKNLKVLPKDMDGRQVVNVMRGFTQALGVRCVYCHVPGANEQDLNTYDFASDEKEHKKAARSMLRFTESLNHDFPMDVGDEPEPGQYRVTCWTCHRGEKEPQTRRPDPPGGPGGAGAQGAQPPKPPAQGQPPPAQPPAAQPPPGQAVRPPAI